MTIGKTERWLPLSGLAAGVLMIVTVIALSHTPEGDAGAANVASYYAAHEGDMARSVVMLGVAAILLLLFAGALRSALARGEGSAPTWSNVAFGGLVVYSAGVLVAASVNLAMSNLPEHVLPSVVQSVNVVGASMWLPILGGSIVMLLGSGAAILRGEGLPRWLGWSALALALIGPTPAGFISWTLGMVWMIVASVVLTAGARRPATAGSAESAPEAAPAV